MALILALAAEVATGMEYLHIHGIIHGRLHPTQSASAPKTMCFQLKHDICSFRCLYKSSREL